MRKYIGDNYQREREGGVHYKEKPREEVGGR